MEKVTGQDLYEVGEKLVVYFFFVVVLGSSLFPRFKGPFKGTTRSEMSALKKKGPTRVVCLGKESHEIL